MMNFWKFSLAVSVAIIKIITAQDLGYLVGNRRFEMFNEYRLHDDAYDACNAKGGKLAQVAQAKTFRALDAALDNIGGGRCWVGGKKTGDNYASIHFYESKDDPNGVPMSSEINGTMLGTEYGVTYPRIYIHSNYNFLQDVWDSYNSMACYICEFYQVRETCLNFTIMEGKTVQSEVERRSVTDYTECAKQCVSVHVCQSALFNTNSGVCILSDMHPIHDTALFGGLEEDSVLISVEA